MLTTKEAIAKRRSIRKFKSDAIAPEILAELTITNLESRCDSMVFEESWKIPDTITFSTPYNCAYW
jgi:hypothetical protein